MDVPQGGSEESERVAPTGGEVEPVESNTVDGGTEDEIIRVEATGCHQKENTGSRLFTEVKPCWTGLISGWVTI